MTTETSTYTYERGVSETVSLTRGRLAPTGHARLKIEHSDGSLSDCFVDLSWLRDRADQLADTPRPLTPDAPECDRHIAHIATQDRVLRHRNRTIRELTQERDEARATKDMHKRRADEERARAEKAEQERDEAHAAMTELAPDEVCVRGSWFKPSELPDVLGRVMDARDEAQREAKRHYLRATWSRPLTPDAITDEMVERARVAALDTYQITVISPGRMRAALTAALTEPPARPEGAEDIEALIEESLSGDALSDQQIADLADRIAEEMNR